MISKNNDGGRNYGGPGTIESVDKDYDVYDGRPDEDDEDDDCIKKIKNSFSYLFFYLRSNGSKHIAPGTTHLIFTRVKRPGILSEEIVQSHLIP